MKAKEFLKDRKLDKGRLTMHLDGADYSVDLQNLLKEYANQRVIDELEKIPQLMIQPLGEEIRLSSYYVLKRIKELKQ